MCLSRLPNTLVISIKIGQSEESTQELYQKISYTVFINRDLLGVLVLSTPFIFTIWS